MKILFLVLALVFLFSGISSAQEVYYGKEHYSPDSPYYMAGKRHYLNFNPQISMQRQLKKMEERLLNAIQEIKDQQGNIQDNLSDIRSGGILFGGYEREGFGYESGPAYQIPVFKHERVRGQQRRYYEPSPGPPPIPSIPNIETQIPPAPSPSGLPLIKTRRGAINPETGEYRPLMR